MNSVQRLVDDIRPLLANIAKDDVHLNTYEQSISVIKINNHNDFRSAKKEILEHGKTRKINPLLLIYGHGEEKKGLILPSGSFISWDLLSSTLSEIINISNGELTVIGAFCHSYKIVEKYKKELKAKLPFSFYYGYSGIISFGDVEKDVYKLVSDCILHGGKNFNISETRFMAYSEFEYISLVISYSLLLSKDPQSLKVLNNETSGALSRRKLRDNFITNSTYPAGISRQIFKAQISSFSFIERIICTLMHDTKRRTVLLKDLQNQF